MLRILHTADWHLGKRLHRHDLLEDQRLFMDWLVDFCKQQKPDALLLSGDIFDMANPSNEARTLYYKSLVRLSKLELSLIVTGGNHDSPAVLNAPAALLKELNIHVIGNLPDDRDECLIPIKNKHGEPECVVAALPYLHDAELRKLTPGQSDEDRLESLRNGIHEVFADMAERCKKQFPKLPAIAMGHLFAAGVSTSESERDIQVGNLAHFDASRFDAHFKYVALGHIHKPQRAGNDGRAYYSGSPYPLSFSEREDKKCIRMIEVENGKTTSHEIEVPAARKLLRISGSWLEVESKLRHLPENTSPLPALLELEIVEEYQSPALAAELENHIADLNLQNAEVVKHRIRAMRKTEGTHELFDSNLRIVELSPNEVLQKRLSADQISDSEKEMIIEAFEELLQEYYQK